MYVANTLLPILKVKTVRCVTIKQKGVAKPIYEGRARFIPAYLMSKNVSSHIVVPSRSPRWVEVILYLGK